MCFKNSYYLELLVYFIHPVSLHIYQVKKHYSLVEYLFQIWSMSCPWVHTNYLSPDLKEKNYNKLLLLFASVQFHVYFLSLFVWHMFEPISWSASKYFKELIQCEICSSIYRYINDDAFFFCVVEKFVFFLLL